MSCHVLILENNREVREAFSKLLRLEGHEVTVASNGREGLAKLEECPDVGLIIVDLLMPGFDGWEFRERQRDRGLHLETPMILVSGVSGDLAGEADALGAVAAVAKPVGPDELCELVDEYGRRREDSRVGS